MNNHFQISVFMKIEPRERKGKKRQSESERNRESENWRQRKKFIVQEEEWEYVCSWSGSATYPVIYCMPRSWQFNSENRQRNETNRDTFSSKKNSQNALNTAWWVRGRVGDPFSPTCFGIKDREGLWKRKSENEPHERSRALETKTDGQKTK